MSLATTLMAVGIPAEQANRLGYEDRVPLDGNGTTQVGATEILPNNTNVALGTSAGDTAFILPAEAELFQPYFALNTTPDAALVYPPVGDTIDANALNTAVEIAEDLARVFQRVEEGRWVSFPAGEGGGGIETIVAGAGINVDATDPDNPIVSNTGVLSVSPGTGIGVGGTAQNPVVSNGGVLSVTAGTNVSITGTAQNPIINASASGTGTVETVAVASANGLAGTSDGDPANPLLTLSTTVTGILSGNGTAISAASTTGSGAVVLATSPTLVTPAIGVASGTSLNLSGLTASSAVATDGSKNLVSVTNTGTGNNVLAAAPTLTGAVLDTGTFLLQNGAATGSFVLGADVNASTLTNATRKIGRIVAPPYTTGQVTSYLLGADNDGTNNTVQFGGAGSASSLQGATQIVFATASALNTTTTTRWLLIDAQGFAAFAGAIGFGAPVTKTADFTLAATENYIINNKAGSACVVTLPAASAWTGRVVKMKTIQAQAINSASSNVVPLAGGAAAAAIVTGTAGRWAELVSDGTNWVIMSGVI